MNRVTALPEQCYSGGPVDVQALLVVCGVTIALGLYVWSTKSVSDKEKTLEEFKEGLNLIDDLLAKVED